MSRAGEDIELLSRFVGAQRLAFQKLLKKYTKWTGSQDLGTRFREDVLNRPTSFSKRDFGDLITQWTEVLASVRAPFEKKSTAQPGAGRARIDGFPPSANKNSLSSSSQNGTHNGIPDDRDSAVLMHSTWEVGSNIDIDTAFSALPLGPKARRAVYWVHPDNIVQIRVLLLQHSRVQKLAGSDLVGNGTPSTRSSQSSAVSRSGNRSTARPDEEVAVILCDDLQKFARLHNSETIGDVEELPGAVSDKAAVVIRYSKTSEATVVVRQWPDSSQPQYNLPSDAPPGKVVLDRKMLPWVFNLAKTSQSNGQALSDRVSKLSSWLERHSEVKPLIQTHSKRTRFAGLKNCDTHGLWAILDTNIRMQSCSQDALTSGRALSSTSDHEKSDMTPFPYAVLEVWTEGNANAELITRLDSSHLVSLRG